LATAGNADAVGLLAARAVDRSDETRLEQLTAVGNTEAGRRLAQRAAERGDVQLIRRLRNAGITEATAALVQLIAERDPAVQGDGLNVDGNAAADHSATG
jgi:hypothetical protein